MTKSKWFLISAAVALVGASAAGQKEDAGLRKEVEAVYAKWDKSVAAGDLKAMFDMIHPSFVFTDKDGKVTHYEQVKKEFTQAFRNAKEGKSKIKVDHVYAQGEEVVAWVTMKVSFKTKVGNKWKPVSFTDKMAETLKRFDGKWKFISTQALP